MRRIADDALLVSGDLLRGHPLASQRLTHGIGHRLWVIAIHVAAQEGGSTEHHVNGAAVHRQGLFHPLDGINHRLEAILADGPAGEGVAQEVAQHEFGRCRDPSSKQALGLGRHIDHGAERLAVEEGHSAIEVRILNPDHVVLPLQLDHDPVFAIGKGLVIHLVWLRDDLDDAGIRQVPNRLLGRHVLHGRVDQLGGGGEDVLEQVVGVGIAPLELLDTGVLVGNAPRLEGSDHIAIVGFTEEGDVPLAFELRPGLFGEEPSFLCQVQGGGIEPIPARFGVKKLGLFAFTLSLEGSDVLGVEKVLTPLGQQQLGPVAGHPAQPVVQVSSQVGKDSQQRILLTRTRLALDHPILPLRQTVKHGRLHGGGGPRRHPCSHIAGVSSIGNAGSLLGVLDGGQRVEHLGVGFLDDAINP